MRQELLMPKLGLTMTEGTVSEWTVAAGASFRQGDTILMIETDKVTTEVPADADGVLLDVSVQAGDVVAVGTVIGHIEVAGDGSVAPAADQGAAKPEPATTAASAAPAAATRIDTAPSAAVPNGNAGRVVATPLARRVAQNMSVDLHKVAGTGPGGRIRADDVRSAASSDASRTASPRVQAAASAPIAVTQPPAAVAQTKLTKPTSIQATMARRLTAAKQQIPHFYLAAEADVSKLLAVRAEINASKPPVKLTLNHLVIAAVARALRDLPAANQVWTDDGIQSFDQVDVGVAVSSERGLLVPVVRDISRVALSEIAIQADEVVDRARQGALKASDVGGGAITVSNAGMHEVTWMTPIVNPGTSMILGVGSIRDVFRPDAEGRPALRREMGLVLAADHRLVDGVAGLTFLNRVIEHLRNPLSLL